VNWHEDGLERYRDGDRYRMQARYRSDAGHRIVGEKGPPDYVWTWLAWGRRGTQDVSWIEAATTAHMRQLGMLRGANLRCSRDGRRFIGRFTSREEAQRACEETLL
jgi:hypothetical protein